MKRSRVLLAGLLLFIGVNPIYASPSSTFWTPCTIDIQPAGVTHLGVDSFFKFGSDGPLDQLPTDIGLEWGAQLTPKLAMEYGFDILTSPSVTPFFLNTKIGYRENVLSKNAPALQLGFFGIGTKREGVDGRQDIVYLTTGKTLPNGKTRLMGSYYVGNSSALKSSTGEVQNTGYMVAIDHQIVPGKWVLAADYASGKNVIGGGGFGVYYYFTDNISLLTGPVWFNDKGINGSSKMVLQLDINF